MSQTFKLKIPVYTKPILSQLQTKLNQFPTETFVEEDNENSLVIGIFTSLAYYFLLFYIYGSSLYKNKIELKNPTEKNNFTMSEAFEGSERIGSTISVLIMASLSFIYWSNKGLRQVLHLIQK